MQKILSKKKKKKGPLLFPPSLSSFIPSVSSVSSSYSSSSSSQLFCVYQSQTMFTLGVLHHKMLQAFVSLKGFSDCVMPVTRTSVCWCSSQYFIKSLQAWLTGILLIEASWRSWVTCPCTIWIWLSNLSPGVDILFVGSRRRGVGRPPTAGGSSYSPCGMVAGRLSPAGSSCNCGPLGGLLKILLSFWSFGRTPHVGSSFSPRGPLVGFLQQETNFSLSTCFKNSQSSGRRKKKISTT